MQLSVIIVNYNVKHFLEQCLNSLQKALKNISHEIYIVDNNSKDDSFEYITSRFDDIIWIQSEKNVGFSSANNLAITEAKGEYVILLNPDTFVNEDTFDICLEILSKVENPGALGVKMLDGSGQYLPESKRGLPTPFVAFCRFSGLAKVYKNSKIFNRYYLGYLSADETHEVDVLCGAFMMIPRNVLDKVGLLDETFFMYGEDIDLSYRIQKAGYKIYYTGHTSIIHYKGESTKKESFDYIKSFNNAMLIFAKKHFSSQRASWFKILIVTGVYIRASISLLTNVGRKMVQPIIDFVLICLILWGQKELWENIYYNNDFYYPESYLWLNIPLYAFIWTAALHFPKKDASFYNHLKYIGIATLILLSIYGLLPLEYRPSRALILFGAASIILYRQVKFWIFEKILNIHSIQKPNLLIVGGGENMQRILQNLEYAGVDFNYVGYLSKSQKNDFTWQGFIEDLPYKVDQLKIDEIIFSSEELSFQKITDWMSQLNGDISYRIAGNDASGIIGSISKNTAGQLYTFDTKYRIQDPYILFIKRSTDIIISLFLLIISPILIWFVQDKLGFFSNCWDVIIGKHSWVSYHRSDPKLNQLPNLKNGILNPLMKYESKVQKSQLIHKMNQLYAKEYTPLEDIKLIFASVKYLGNSLL